MSQRKDEARAKARKLIARARKQLSTSVSMLVEAGHADQAKAIGDSIAALEPVVEAIGEPPPKAPSKPKPKG
jgi:hypothetical protein